MYNQQMAKLGTERSVIREIFEYGNARKRQIGADKVFDFSLGNPSVPAPDCVREEAERLLQSVPAQELHGYTSAAGAMEVRQAVADDYKKRWGVPMRAELVYMTCGAAASLSAALCAVCNAGDEVIVLTPYFPEYRVFVARAGAKVVPVSTRKNFHLDLAAIERAITRKTAAIIINSPNNPTGVVYSETELTALAVLLKEASQKRGAPIVLLSDEPYRELTYGAEVPCIMNLYADTVACYSFSKSLSLAGERIGYVAINPQCTGAEQLFAAVCGAGRSLGYVCAPALFQRVTAACLGQAGDIGVYRKNRDMLYEALSKYGFECILPDGAFYLFMKSPEEDAKAFCERAKQYELLLVPSDSFGIEGYVRISTCVETDMILRSLPAFEKLAREYKN